MSATVKKLRSTDRNYIELDLQLIADTSRALLLSDGITEVWIPISQMEDDPEQLENGLFRVIIPEWLAIKGGFV